ncbi:hypothetical protein N0V94_002974 [Neodidymelliopsis sp. IMI 364377]|nr:hypothetical protein N0V94_002974 [Neodidymelliopsis sp. IMI 364377]
MPNQHYATHTPVRSSPLRERSLNASTGFFGFDMDSKPVEKQTTHSQRTYKANPMMQTRDAATKRRRDMFFKRVQNSREDRRWESRGEQIQQLDFVSERKRWENRKAREAPPEENEIDEQLLSDAILPRAFDKTPQREAEMTEAEYVLAQEEYELQELIASMESEQSQDPIPQHYGSDDEDYDQIFMECAPDIDLQSQQPHQVQAGGCGDMDDMDMTDG